MAQEMKSYSAPSRFDRVSKQPSVKADLAIYSHMLGFGVPGQCYSVALLLNKL